MTGRPHVLVTREGWYYLFVVLFIVGGAVLREVNLLVVLAGMMISPLLFNWRMVVRSMRRASVRRQAPARCEAGRAARVRLHVTNGAARDTIWMLSAIDTVRRDDGRRQRATVEVSLPCVAPGAVETASYRLVLGDRGRYRLGPLRLQTRWPFGLMRSSVSETKEHELIVWPRAGQLTSGWRSLLRGEPSGAQRSRSKRGQDGEFYALRPFTAGDSLRMVHWRSTVRVGEPMVRQNELLELPEISLLLDPYLPPDAGPDDRERMERMLRLAAAIVLDICRESGCHLAVTLAGEEIDSWRADPTRRFAEELLDQLALVSGHAAPLAAAVATAFQLAKAPPIIVSTRPDCRDALRGDLPGQLHGILDRASWLSIDAAEGSIYLDSVVDDRQLPEDLRARAASKRAGSKRAGSKRAGGRANEGAADATH